MRREQNFLSFLKQVLPILSVTSILTWKELIRGGRIVSMPEPTMQGGESITF